MERRNGVSIKKFKKGGIERVRRFMEYAEEEAIY